ncbi:tRNA pseudouridine synthase A [Marinilabiliaceae bacterium JC017]|nr:tRNA pseudouridine synthase A [Marinilabiliaceae bacterium JC017]
MHTIKIKIHDKVYNHFLWLLSKFSKDEIEIIDENDTFTKAQTLLQNELNEMNEGTASYYSIDELEARLEDKIKKHEDNL